MNERNYFKKQLIAHQIFTKIGSLRLYPNEVFIEPLKHDSEKMAEMFFGDVPDFDSTLNEIKRLEKVINVENSLA